MDLNDLKNYFQTLPDRIMDVAPDIVADTATEYFKDRFTEKAFDGNPWAEPKKPKKTGSLLVRSGALANSIRPSYIGKDKVTISAGDMKVDYARVHNEGFQGAVVVNPFSRRTKSGKIASVKSHTRNMDIPQRQFMGNSKELAQSIHDRLQPAVAAVAKEIKR